MIADLTIDVAKSEVLLCIALVLFLIAAVVKLQAAMPRVNLVALGLAFLAAALVVAT